MQPISIHRHAVQVENPSDLWLARYASAVPSLLAGICTIGAHRLAGIWKLTYYMIFFVDFFLHLIGDFSAGISMLYDMGFRSDLAEGRKQL